VGSWNAHSPSYVLKENTTAIRHDDDHTITGIFANKNKTVSTHVVSPGFPALQKNNNGICHAQNVEISVTSASEE